MVLFVVAAEGIFCENPKDSQYKCLSTNSFDEGPVMVFRGLEPEQLIAMNTLQVA